MLGNKNLKKILWLTLKKNTFKKNILLLIYNFGYMLSWLMSYGNYFTVQDHGNSYQSALYRLYNGLLLHTQSKTGI